MTLRKKDIIDMACGKLNMTKDESGRMIDSFFEIIKDHLKQGNEVKISGFGKWTVRKKRARDGRNLKTGEGVRIEARKVVTFGCSKILRQKMKGES